MYFLNKNKYIVFYVQVIKPCPFDDDSYELS